MSNAGRPPRVLVVEDDYIISLEIEYRLSTAGFEVVGIAKSADQALAMAQAHRPAVVVMDIRLRGDRDGIAAAVDIYNEMGVRSIFATAHLDPDVQLRAQAARPLGWLVKPYDMGELVQLVRDAFVGDGRPAP